MRTKKNEGKKHHFIAKPSALEPRALMEVWNGVFISEQPMGRNYRYTIGMCTLNSAIPDIVVLLTARIGGKPYLEQRRYVLCTAQADPACTQISASIPTKIRQYAAFVLSTAHNRHIFLGLVRQMCERFS